MTGQRCIWSEHVPYELLSDPALLRALARRGLALFVGVEPHCVDQLPGLLEACRAQGVAVGLWPLLSNAEGRWLNDRTLVPMTAHVTRVLSVLSAPHPVEELVLDLEPPREIVRAGTLGPKRLQWLTRPKQLETTRQGVGELVNRGRARGLGVSLVVAPFLLWDPPDGDGVQALLGTPVRDIDCDRVWVMVYSSLFEGYSRGLLRRRDARALAQGFSQRAVGRFGPKAGVCLGVVGGGALGDEQPYRGPHELLEDSALVQTAGVRDVALFGLAGMLARPPLEPWLDALGQPVAAPSRSRSLRAGGLPLGGALAGRLLSARLGRPR